MAGLLTARSARRGSVSPSCAIDDSPPLTSAALRRADSEAWIEARDGNPELLEKRRCSSCGQTHLRRFSEYRILRAGRAGVELDDLVVLQVTDLPALRLMPTSPKPARLPIGINSAHQHSSSPTETPGGAAGTPTLAATRLSI